MQPTKELADELYREDILRARAMSPELKLLAGAHLFDRVCRIMCDGIRHEFPDANEEQVRHILRQRLALARRLESHS
jgi:hypothetical protein